MADVVRRVITQMGLDAAQYERGAQAVEQANLKMVQSGARVVDSTEKVTLRQTASSSAVDRIERSVDRAVRAHHAYQRQLSIVDKALQDGNISASRHAEVTKKVEENYKKAADAADRAAGAKQRVTTATDILRRAFIALGGAMLIREFIRMADVWSDMTARVNIAVGSVDRGSEVMARLGKIAQRTYSDINLTTESFLLNATALRELGYTTNQQLDYTEALNNALVVSGAKGERAASVQNALSKAMALGTLQGENLNTVIQIGGRVAEALADGLGVSTNELRKLGSEGKLTTQAVFAALVSQMEKLRQQADAMPETFGDGLTRLRNQLIQTIGEISLAEGTTGDLNKVLTELREAIASDEFKTGITFLAQGLGAIASATADLVAAMGKLNEIFSSGGVIAGIKELGKYLFVGASALVGTGEWALGVVGGPNAPKPAPTATDAALGAWTGVGPGSVSVPTVPLGGATKGYDNKLSELKAQAEQQERLLAAYREGPAAVLAHEKALALLAKTQGLSEKLTVAERKALESYLVRIDEAQRAIKDMQALKAAEARVWESAERARIASITDPTAREAAERAIERQKEINRLTQEYGTVAEGTGQKLLEMWDKARASDEQARFWSDVRSKAEDISNDISQFLVDGFVNAERGGQSAFKNLWDGAMAGVKRFVANMAAEFLKTKIIMPIVMSVVGGASGAFGIAGAGGGLPGVAANIVSGGGGFGLGGLSSLGSLFSGGLSSSFLTGIGMDIANSGIGQALGLSMAMPKGGTMLTGLGGSFSGALGNLPYAGIGSMLGAMLGGGSGNMLIDTGLGLAGGIGGSMIGSTIGMLGAAGGPIGAVVGAMVGSLAGSLFKKEPSDKAARTNIDILAGDIADATFNASKKSQQTIDASQKMAETFLTVAQALEAVTGGTGATQAFVIAGERDGFRAYVGDRAGISHKDAEVRTFKDAEKAVEWMISAFAKSLTGVEDQDFRTVLKRKGNPETLLQNLDWLQQYKTLIKEPELQTVAKAIEQVNAQWGEMIEKAKELGVSTAGAIAARERDIASILAQRDAMRTAANDNMTLREMALAGDNRGILAMTLQLERSRQLAEAREQVDLGIYTENQYARLAKLIDNEIIKTMTDFDAAVKAATQAANDNAIRAEMPFWQESLQAGQQIMSFLDRQALSGSASPIQRFNEAERQYRELLATVEGGDLGQTGSLTSAAQNFLDISRQRFASSPVQAQIESMVRGDLASLGATVLSESATLERMDARLGQGFAGMIDELQQIKAELAETRQELARQATLNRAQATA